MFKRIMKILGIVFGGFTVIAGAIFGVVALTGGFEEKTIHLRKVYFDGVETDTERDIYTLTDQTFKIDYLPLDATDKVLTVKIDGEECLDNPPKTVIAGEPFTLKIRKDEKGNNIAGGVYLQIGRDQAWVKIYMRVDVAIPDNVLYFAGNTNDKITATGKKFTLAKSTEKTDVYLKSELVNAFNVSFADEDGVSVDKQKNIKSALIDYTYYDLEGNVIETKTPEHFENLTTESIRDTSTNTVNHFFKIPVIPSESGKIVINAKMHRTYEIEQAYNQGKFNELATLMKNNGTQNSAVRTMLYNFNEFLNKYIEYFDKTPESYAWFKEYIKNDGTIEIDTVEGVTGAHNFIFVSCSAEIDVTAVNLQKIESKASITKYKVFDSVNLAKTDDVKVGTSNAFNILDEYDLKLTLDNGEQVENYDSAVANLYDTLSVDAYVYLQSDSPVENSIPVYGFLVNDREEITYQPITEKIWNSFSIEEKSEYVEFGYVGADDDLQLTDEGIVGYLIPLKGNTQYNFIEVNPLKATSGKPYWQANFNVPLTQSADEQEILRALYLGFKVEGWDIKNNVKLVRETFSRIVIDYTPYDIKEGQYLELSSLDGNSSVVELKKSMALNSNLSPTSLGANYANNEQIINVDLNSNVNNLSDLQYTNVLYFAESTSNKTATSDKKVFTVGKYNFIGMDGSEYILGENPLEGERIPVSKIAGIQAGTNKPVIYGLNASDEPVKVFAVVYLSDKDGNPIDLNGRVIEVDETVDEEATGIYVIAISNYLDTTNDIYLDSFVENINYYTKVATEGDSAFKFGEYTLSLNSEYFKRNNVTGLSYEDESGEEKLLTGEDLKAYQNFLALKLIQGLPLTISITNMEMGETPEKATIALDAIGINGKTITFEPEQNIANNKQIAFNNMCKHFETDYQIFVDSNIIVSDVEKVGEDGVYSEINFKLSISNTAEAEDIDGTTGTLYIGPNIGNNEDEYLGVLPFSESLTSSRASNQVTYIKNTLKITGVGDVQYEDPDGISSGPALRYSQLLAQFSQDANIHDGTLGFKIDDGSEEFVPYSIPEIKDLSVLLESITTNLAPKTENGEGLQKQYNYDIVDISQEMEETEGESPIKDLITNSISSNNLVLSFLMPSKVAVLNDAVEFTNLTDSKGDGAGEYIYIGGNKVPLEGKVAGGILTVADKPYTIMEKTTQAGDDYLCIVIPKGTYFPIVDELVLGPDGKYISKQYVMMLDEKFEIVKEGESLVITPSEATSVLGKRSVTITDKINSQDEVLTDYLNGSSGQYNFIKGSEGGTDVFLILNIGFIPQNSNQNDCKFNFQKLFTYTLKQNPVELKGYCNGDVNSQDNPLEVEGGEEIIIKLSAIGDTYISDYRGDQYIFNHTTFSRRTENILFVDDENPDGTGTLTANSRGEIRIRANICGGDQTASIRLSYLYQGEIQYFDYYLKIKANYQFAAKSGSGCTLIGDIFKLNLTAGVYDIYDTDSATQDIISKYFDLSEVANVTLKGTGASGNTLTIADSFASQGNENITKETASYSIELTLNKTDKDGNNIVVTLPQTLSITIEPTAVIDALQVSNSLNTALLGTNIFNYVKLYEYVNNGIGNLIDIEDSRYDSIQFIINTYKIGSNTPVANGTNEITYSIDENGKISGPINTEDVTLTFTIIYPVHNVNIRINGSIVVEGVKMYYSTSGSYTSDNTEVQQSELFNNGGNANVDYENNLITIYVTRNVSTINLYNYIDIHGNTGAHPLYAYVKTASGGYTNNISLGTEYDLYYAKQTASGIENIIKTGYKVKYVVVNSYFDELGTITEETTEADLQGKEFINNSVAYEITLNITTTDNTQIDMSKYIKIFAGDSNINFALKQDGGASYITSVKSGITNSSDEYKIYVYNGAGDKIDTGYSIVINITIA